MIRKRTRRKDNIIRLANDSTVHGCNGYELLATAIIAQAVNDYQGAKRRLAVGIVKYEGALCEELISGVERFLDSEWYKALTELPVFHIKRRLGIITKGKK